MVTMPSNYSQELLNVLAQISGASGGPVNTESMKMAEEKLAEIQQRSKSAICMEFLNIIMAEEVNESIKTLAAIRVKSTLELAWRRRLRDGTGIEDPEQRNLIRNTLLQIGNFNL